MEEHGIPSFSLKVFFLNCSVTALQCCVYFCCTTVRIIIHTHTSPRSWAPSPAVITEHRAGLPLLDLILHIIAPLVAQLAKDPPAMRETCV